MRCLAVDLGRKRTGLALGDTSTGTAGPLRVLETSTETALLAKVLHAIEVHGPDLVVLGLPLNMDGTEGPAAAAARAFGTALARQTTVKLAFQDERLTSFAAEQVLAGSGRTRREKKKLHDALAAVEILQDYMQG